MSEELSMKEVHQMTRDIREFAGEHGHQCMVWFVHKHTRRGFLSIEKMTDKQVLLMIKTILEKRNINPRILMVPNTDKKENQN